VRSCSVTVVNPLGLHARAAAKFVHLASSFASGIRVARGAREMDGKSIMGLLLLSAAQGTAITISADGVDERTAIAALCGLVERGFDETPANGVQGTPVDGSRGGSCA
jgi:phosphocarrier protein HPr